MKKLTFSFLFLIFISGTLYAQSGWVQQSTNANVPIRKIYFVDQYTGWCSAAGSMTFVSYGFFMKTTNGGSTWVSQLSGTYGYSSFCYVNSAVLWLTGNYWDDMVNLRRTVLKSTNGGLNWTSSFLDSSNGSFNSVCFINNNTGFVAGQNYPVAMIMKTTNSGVDWIQSGFPGESEFNDIYFLNQQTGIITCSGTGSILVTTNTGTSWNLKSSLPGTALYKIFFYDQLTGWISGTGGVIEKTTNSGQTWTLLPSGTVAALTDISFTSPDTGYTVSSDYAGGTGHVFKTVNAGQNWTDNFMTSGAVFNSVFFINGITGWIGGGYGSPMNIGTIYKTTNGGEPLGLQQISNKIPGTFSLSQNYPNPFNPVTKIKFDIPSVGNGPDRFVKLIIYDILGREVATLVNEHLKPGSYEAEWDGSNSASGIYFYTLQTEQFTETKKMVLIK